MKSEAQGLFPLASLCLWYDPVARSGRASLDLDRFLLEKSSFPILRIYRWGEPVISYGYFDTEKEARALFPSAEGVVYEHRWTGGGIVDHRVDRPFSLIIPIQPGKFKPTSSEMYAIIHGALSKVLNRMGVTCTPQKNQDRMLGRGCFSNPVTDDLLLPNGHKLVGGAMRRTRRGILYQGSMVFTELPSKWSEEFAQSLAITFFRSSWELSDLLELL